MDDLTHRHNGKMSRIKAARDEITEATRLSVERWIMDPEMIGCENLCPSRVHASPHLSTREYARIMRDWVLLIGLEASTYGTHSDLHNFRRPRAL